MKKYPEPRFAEFLFLKEEGQSKDILERSFEFAIRIVKLCRHLDAEPGVSRTLCSQILRAGTSIGANVEEAQAGQSRADFISKMGIALKEARETHFRLRVLAASELVSSSRLANLVEESEQLKKICGAIIVSAKKSSNGK